MFDTAIPDLTLHGLTLSPQQDPVDLRYLLYHGLASAFQRNIKRSIEAGERGRPQLERLPLLTAIHGNWQAGISAKTLADETIRTYWRSLRSFVTFAETVKKPLSIAGVLRLYLEYCAQISCRTDLSENTRYSHSQVLSAVIGPVLGIEGRKLQWKTKIRVPRRLGKQAAKENLDSTTTFVQTLLETIEQLDVCVIKGPLPVTLRYAAGGQQIIHCGGAFKSMDTLKGTAAQQTRSLEARNRRADDKSNRARARLINLRIEAELLVFINQTAANLTQALHLTGSQFRYQSDGDYLHIYVWKNRAKHSVNLKIHKAFRSHFETYLRWRNAIFPDDPDGLTFPFVWNDGEKTMRRTNWVFGGVRKLMVSIGQPYVHTLQLRKSAGNFIKRKVSRQAAAELLCNTEKTFSESYEEAHHQTAVAELVSFWSDLETVVAAVGPGGCKNADPKPSADVPEGSPKPDCESFAGCLFCAENRDLRSFDHVWNLASLHYLKLAEFTADRTPLSSSTSHPAALAVARIKDKLDAINMLGGEYTAWVVEAMLRVSEGRYHPFYTASFEILEGPP